MHVYGMVAHVFLEKLFFYFSSSIIEPNSKKFNYKTISNFLICITKLEKKLFIKLSIISAISIMITISGVWIEWPYKIDKIKKMNFVEKNVIAWIDNNTSISTHLCQCLIYCTVRMQFLMEGMTIHTHR